MYVAVPHCRVVAVVADDDGALIAVRRCTLSWRRFCRSDKNYGMPATWLSSPCPPTRMVRAVCVCVCANARDPRPADAFGSRSSAAHPLLVSLVYARVRLNGAERCARIHIKPISRMLHIPVIKGAVQPGAPFAGTNCILRLG